MSHTPGPWHTATDGAVWSGKEPVGIYSGTKDPKGGWTNSQQVWPPYDCDPQGMHYQRHLADIRLMVASPELLAACNRSLELLDMIQPQYRQEAAEVFNQLRTASAKAEGAAS